LQVENAVIDWFVPKFTVEESEASAMSIKKLRIRTVPKARRSIEVEIFILRAIGDHDDALAPRAASS
jgi:hypothetical protein